MDKRASNNKTFRTVESADGIELIFERLLAAPRELVFHAWTEPRHFAAWFGPREFEVESLTIDARPGGRLHFCHRASTPVAIGEHNLMEIWIQGEFVEVLPPELLVFRIGFSDPEGNVVEHQGIARETIVRVELSDVAEGTRMRLSHRGLTIDRGEGAGWTEGLDRLEELLAKIAGDA